MRRAIVLVLATAAIGIGASPAAAQIVVGGSGGSTTATIGGGATIGSNYTIYFDGEENGTIVPGLTSSLQLTYEGTSGTSYLFNYLLSNTSMIPSAATVFGFDISPTDLNLNGSNASGTFNVVSSGSITNQTLAFCVKNGNTNSCNNSPGNTGVNNGLIGSGSFAIDFNTLPSSITLSNILDRYQNVGNDGGSAIGVPTTPAVPEPATWAMMLIGFGGIGLAMRRKASNLRLMQIARA